MRAVIYTRVSKDLLQRARSVSQQEAECRAVCEREGWDVVAVFSDNDRSASRYARKDRGDWTALVAYVSDAGADVIVLWEVSRSTRDLRVGLDLRDLCEARGVLINYSGRTYDMRDSRDRRHFTNDISNAEGESDQTRDRILRDTRSNAVAGRPHGKNTYGLRRVYDPGTRELVRVEEHPDQAPVVREAARRVLAGEALFSIRADFIARGVPAPGKAGWDLTGVRRCLLNPAMIGKRVYQGQIIGDAIWPAILDEDDWVAIRTRLVDPARRTTTRQGSLRHLLSHLARCGICGKHAVARKHNAGVIGYRCVDSHFARPRGQWRGWPRPEDWTDRFDGVDDVVVSLVLERLSRPDVLDALAADDPDEAVRARAELTALRQRLDGFVDTAAAGELTPAALARIEAKLLPQIAAAELAAAPRGIPRVVTDLAGSADASAQWLALTLAQQREVIGTLMTVELLPAGKGNRRWFDPETVRVRWTGED